jgi:hypothetical protein
MELVVETDCALNGYQPCLNRNAFLNFRQPALVATQHTEWHYVPHRPETAE